MTLNWIWQAYESLKFALIFDQNLKYFFNFLIAGNRWKGNNAQSETIIKWMRKKNEYDAKNCMQTELSKSVQNGFFI